MNWLTCGEQYHCARLPTPSGERRSASWVDPDSERVDGVDGEACRSFQLVRISVPEQDIGWLHRHITSFLFFSYWRIMTVASVIRWVWG